MSLMTYGTYLNRDDSSCIFFRDSYHHKLRTVLPGFEDLSPLPVDLDTGYLQKLPYTDFAEIPSELSVMPFL